MKALEDLLKKELQDKLVKNEANDENLFNELKTYIEEEKVHHQLKVERSGERFFFYKADHVIVRGISLNGTWL